jgi:hypothetical protein
MTLEILSGKADVSITPICGAAVPASEMNSSLPTRAMPDAPLAGICWTR